MIKIVRELSTIRLDKKSRQLAEISRISRRRAGLADATAGDYDVLSPVDRIGYRLRVGGGRQCSRSGPSHAVNPQRLCCKNSLTIQDVAVTISSSLLQNVTKIFFATEPVNMIPPAKNFPTSATT